MSPRRLIFFALFSTAAYAVDCPTPGTLTSGGTAIGGIADGALLSATSTWYDLSTNTVNIPVVMLVGNCHVRINAMTPVLTGGQWMVKVPMGTSSLWPTPTTVYQGKMFWQIAYIGALTDPHRVNKPLLYEVVDNATGDVMVRTKIVLRDRREDSTFNATYTAATLMNGAGMELSQAGADKLERVHVASLPQPSLPVFNTGLTSRFQNQSLSIGTDTNYGSAGKACTSLANADPEFQLTTAYAGVTALSTFSLKAWQAADNTCKNSPDPVAAAAACAVAATICVRDDTPTPSNYELCAQRVSGQSRTLSLASVNSADLSITNGAPLNSTIGLGRLDGTVDGTLSEFFIRWSDSHAGCVVRPTVSLSATDEARSAIQAWRACAGLEVDSEFAQSGRIQHPLTGSSVELLTAAATATLPLFTLDPAHPRNPDKGSCSKFRDAVLQMLDLYYPRMQSALDATWLAPQQHAAAMDDLTSVWETGLNEQMADVDLVMNPQTPTQLGGNRFSLYYKTAVNVPVGTPSGYVYSEPSDFPCYEPPLSGIPGIPCNSGMNTYGNPFDASYTVTTPAINQILRARHTGLRVTPTFNDLGLNPPAGKTGTDTWEVDGAWLSSLFNAFSNLGTTKLRLKLDPLHTPFTYMSRDARYYYPLGGQIPLFTAVPRGETPLTYQIAQYSVKLVGDQPGPDGSDVWAELKADLYDPNFQMSVSGDPAKQELIPAYSTARGTLFTLVKSQFTACPVAPYGETDKCGNQLATLIAAMVKPKFEALLLNAVSGYPAPVRFDARGKAQQTRTFVPGPRFFEGQVMMFYGNLN